MSEELLNDLKLWEGSACIAQLKSKSQVMANIIHSSWVNAKKHWKLR